MNGRNRQQGGRSQQQQPKIDTSKINFKDLDPELFNETAKFYAEKIASVRKGNSDRLNSPTQLRKFYDELCMWDAKVNMDEKSFQECRPFILMLNAKAAYANGRKPPLVDNGYVTLLGDCLNQVETAKEFRTCKVFMEAFMGFYKSVA